MKNNISNPNAAYGWIRIGLYYGAFMYAFSMMFSILEGEPITLRKVLIRLLIWALGGLAFGYTMKRINNRKKAKSEEY